MAAWLVVAAVLGFGFRAITRNTPVTREEALEQFAEDKRSAEKKKDRRKAGKLNNERSSRRGGEVNPGRGRPAPTKAGSRSHEDAPGSPLGGSIVAGSGAVSATRVPDEGTYAYSGGGQERFEYYSRKIPEESFRTVVHQGPARWSDHHLFSHERESWSYYELTSGGRLTYSQRNKVVFAEIARDVTVTFSPPVQSSIFPWRDGRMWSGAISGEASGDSKGEVTGRYEGTTLRQEALAVDGGPVETWLDHIHLELHGAVEGDVDVKRWVSPATGLTVREEYVADVEIGGGLTYTAEWYIQLRSLNPVD